MFKLQRTAHYWWPIKVRFAADGGERQEEDFEVKFTRLGIAAVRGMIQEARDKNLPDSDIVRRIVLDWRNVVDADGQVVQFSREALAELCDLPGVAAAILSAFFASHDGSAAGN